MAYSNPAHPTLTWVYFVQAQAPPHLVKIGKTWRKPSTRIKSLQTDSPVELVPVLLLAGNAALEEICHMVFHRYRRHGEWFAAAGDLARFIKDCRARSVKYVGPEVARTMLLPLAEAADRREADECQRLFDGAHETFLWRYPWLRGQDLEKIASNVLNAAHSGSSISESAAPPI